MQAVGQCVYLRPFVEDFTPTWLLGSSLSLTCGAMVLMWISEARGRLTPPWRAPGADLARAPPPPQVLTELKLGNGTSLLIFVNILSSLPYSAGQTLTQASSDGNNAGLVAFAASFLAICTGIVYVQARARPSQPLRRSAACDAI